MLHPRPAPTEAMRWAPPPAAPQAAIRCLQTRLMAHAAVGLNGCFGSIAGNAFGILMYHRIAREPARAPRPTINVTPERFRAQLRGLLDRGFRFRPLRSVLDDARNGRIIPPRDVVVTFDDGFENVYRDAVPVLRELAIPATIFVATAFLDSDEPYPFDHWGLAHRHRVPPESYRPMRLPQCLELNDDPLIELAAHTHTHQDFRGRPDAFEYDLRVCLAFLKNRFGIENPTFAFPYGSFHLGFVDGELIAAAKRTDVACGLTTESGLVFPGEDPFRWGRINVFPWDSGRTLTAKLNGWYTWAPRLQHRLIHAARRLARQADSINTSRATRGGASPAFGVDIEFEPGRTRDPGEGRVESNGECADRGASGERAAPGVRPMIRVVVPTFNRAAWLREALESLTRQETRGRFTFEIVVVDNASSDNTRDVVERIAAGTPVPVHYRYQAKAGDAPTRNAGIRDARGEYLAFFDDDQLADSRWLVSLFDASRTTGALVVGGPVLLDLPDATLRRLDRTCRRALREAAFYERTQPYAGRDMPGTGNALVARRLFEQVGLFDESMVTGGSDTDFFHRVRASGYELWYAPEAVIRHRIPPERLQEDFLRWDARSGGSGQARDVDLKESGRLGVARRCALRLLFAVAAVGPAHLLARWRGDAGRMLGTRIRLWRIEGYARATLRILAPRWFPQSTYFRSIEFRNGRVVAARPEIDRSESAEPCHAPRVPVDGGRCTATDSSRPEIQEVAS